MAFPAGEFTATQRRSTALRRVAAAWVGGWASGSCVFSPTPVPTSPEATALNRAWERPAPRLPIESHRPLQTRDAAPSQRRPGSRKWPRVPTHVSGPSSGSGRHPRVPRPCGGDAVAMSVGCLLRSAARVSARANGDRQGGPGEDVRQTDGHTLLPPAPAQRLASRAHGARTHG